MVDEVIDNKQIVITTHSPELFKNLNINNLFFISRDDDGFSKISKPIDNDVVMSFIEELGIGSVFIDNYLRI